MFGNNGYNVIKTPYKKTNPVRTSSSNINKSLENENKSLRAEIAKKDKMLVDCRRQVEYLQKRLSELSRNNNNSSNSNNYRSSNSNSNNFHYQRSNSQSNHYERKTNNHEGNRANRMLFGNFDDFTEAFFNEPFAFFNDQIFNTGNRNRISNERNRTVNHNYNNYNPNYNSVPQNTDIESDIIDQLYPNPDNMTYEQLLALEEQVGSVSKGLSKSDINVSLNA